MITVAVTLNPTQDQLVKVMWKIMNLVYYPISCEQHDVIMMQHYIIMMTLLLLQECDVANVKFFFLQIINQDISLGARDYYTISFLMDAIAFIIIVIGFSAFGVCACVYSIIA